MAATRRLVTRSGFDGLACAMMLKELGMIDEIKFVHPKDVQDGKIELTKNDITTNLPYDPRVGLAFDHHESEIDRLKAVETNGKLIIDEKARSAARVVYDYYGGEEKIPNMTVYTPQVLADFMKNAGFRSIRIERNKNMFCVSGIAEKTE